MQLRPLSLDDLDHIMHWVNDPDVVGKFEWYTGTVTREQERAMLEQLIAGDDKIYSVYNGQYVGQVGLHDIQDGAARMSIVLDKDRWGHQYGEHAIRALINIAQDNDIHILWATPRVENTKMQHIAEKCGFENEGVMPDAYTLRGETYDLAKLVWRES